MEGRSDHKVLIVPLEKIDEHLPQIEYFFGYKADTGGNAWKRKTPNKQPFFLADYVDLNPYQKHMRILGYP